jgi:hypothetical protein
MSDSEFPLYDLTTWAPFINRSAFRVTLRDVDGFEGFDSREFDLAIDSQFPIGRASKNTTKKDLMPASSNAYIDSPVISREHAVLSANAHSGDPHVFITDAGSMHGTMVNGQRLPAHTPKQLASGDKLQFGIDVNRNEGTHSHPLYISPPLCITDTLSSPQSSSSHANTSLRPILHAHRHPSRSASLCLTVTRRKLVVRPSAKAVRPIHLLSMNQTPSRVSLTTIIPT